MKKKSTILILVIIVILIVVVGIFILINKSNKYFANLNEKLNIKEDNIDIIVNSVENVTINDPTGISLSSGDYIKVNLSIINNNSEEFSWTKLWSFSLIDADGNNIGMSILTETNDDLPTTVSPNETVTGSLYFKTTLQNGMKLEYVAKNAENINDLKHYYVRLK